MKQTNYIGLMLVFASFFGSSALAQSVSPDDQLYWLRYRTSMYNTYSYTMPVIYDKHEDYVKNRAITKFTQEKQSFSKRGKAQKIKWYRTFNYDTAGRCVGVAGGRAGKPLSWQNKYAYNDKGFIYQIISLDKKGEVTGIKQYDYDTVSEIRYHYYEINKNGDTTVQSKRGRLDTISLTSTDYYYKKGKLKYTWENAYYPNKSKKQTIVYNKKGKQEYVWDFQCKEEGLERTKQKDTSTICTSKTYEADSTVTEVYLTIDSKGIAYKEVYKKNKFGKTLEYSRSNEKEGWQLNNSRYTYATDGKTMIAYSYSYYQKGLLTTEWNTMLDTVGNRVAQTSNTYKKGVLESSTTENYEYDKQNRPIVKKVLLADGNPREITTFKYN